MWEDTGPAVFKAAPLSGGAAVQISRHGGAVCFFFYSIFPSSILADTRRDEKERKHDARYAICKMEKKKERRERGGREGAVAAINLLCDDSRSSETSNQAHLSERARKKKTSSQRRRCGSSALSLKAAEMPSCTFHSKSPRGNSDISNLVMGIFTLLPLFVSHPQGDE